MNFNFSHNKTKQRRKLNAYIWISIFKKWKTDFICKISNYLLDWLYESYNNEIALDFDKTLNCLYWNKKHLDVEWKIGRMIFATC